MNWIESNKKFTVFLVITAVLACVVILQAIKVPVDETLTGTILGAWIMGTKEWLDGKPGD